MSTKPLAESLHDELHRIPGMPAHETAASNNTHQPHTHASANHANPAGSNRNRNSGDPTVLVGWQRRVARFFGRDDD